MSVIRQSGEALISLINDILDFSKIEAGKLELEYVDFNLRSLMYDVVNLLIQRAKDKNIEILVDYPVNMPSSFIGDPARLRQVMLNLLGNAVKFTEKGYVVIGAYCMDLDKNNHMSDVRIFVRDTGIGLTLEERQQLFQIFSQADSSTTRKYGGTGLGLAICRRLVDLMNGHIDVRSEKYQGSEFFFTLNLPYQEPEVINTLTYQRLNVLVVDDIEASLAIIQTQLEAYGIFADCCESVETALRHVEKESALYQVIIIDEQLINLNKPAINDSKVSEVNNAKTLSDKSGNDKETIQRLLDYSVPIILMASHGSVDEEAKNNPYFNAVVTKPIQIDKLLRAIDEVQGMTESSSQENSDDKVAGETLIKCEGNVLVVDDNSTNLMIAELILTDAGMTVFLADSGKKAIEMWKEGGIEVILMDCLMPDMDGYQTTRAIRELETEFRVPIVALTASTFQNVKDQCKESGMDDFIAKPFVEEELLAKVSHWVMIARLAVKRAKRANDAR